MGVGLLARTEAAASSQRGAQEVELGGRRTALPVRRGVFANVQVFSAEVS